MKKATSVQERLWELRKDKGLNLEELSELTGISKSALGSYEKEDYKEINHGNLITLADFYGVSVDYLLCRTENREQINTPLTELHLNDEAVALLWKSEKPFNLPGDYLGKVWAVIFNMLGMDFYKLSPDEQKTLKKVLSKSPAIKNSPVN